MLKYLLGFVLFFLALNSGAGTISTIYYILIYYMALCLQLDKYSKSDLYDIFDLKENEVHTLNINHKCSKYIDEIESNQNIELSEKINLVGFLKKAMNKNIDESVEITDILDKWRLSLV